MTLPGFEARTAQPVAERVIEGVLYEVPTGETVSIPLKHLAAFGVTQASGKTTFIESASTASHLKVITFRTKRGELSFEGATRIPIFFDERGLTHWKALEGLIAATLEEKVSREPGMRAAIIHICTTPYPTDSLEEIHRRVKAKLEDPKVRGFQRDVFVKLDAYLSEVLPQIKKLREQLTNRLEVEKPGLYVEDLVGQSDEMQSLLLASVMKKVYEEMNDTAVVLPEVWKFLPQDRGSPVKWMIEKYVREMLSARCYLFIDVQDLRGVDKKHLRSVETRLFGRQPDAHEIEELFKALPLPARQRPTVSQIMTLPLGHFYAKVEDAVKLVYVRPVWLPEDVAKRVARGELSPKSLEVQAYKPEPKPPPEKPVEATTVPLIQPETRLQEAVGEVERQLQRVTELARQVYG